MFYVDIISNITRHVLISVYITIYNDTVLMLCIYIGVTLPAGLTNMGNTCYMNATIQCIRNMTSIREVIQPIQTINTNSSILLTNAFKNTLNQLDASTTAVTPIVFVQLLRAHFPQFAQMTHGHYMQQDAEEFFNILSTELSNGISAFNQQQNTTSSPAFQHNNSSTNQQSSLDSLLTLQVEQTLTCNEVRI